MILNIKIKTITKEDVLEKAKILQQKRAYLSFKEKEISHLKEKLKERDNRTADEFLVSKI